MVGPTISGGEVGRGGGPCGNGCRVLRDATDLLWRHRLFSFRCTRVGGADRSLDREEAVSKVAISRCRPNLSTMR